MSDTIPTEYVGLGNNAMPSWLIRDNRDAAAQVAETSRSPTSTPVDWYRVSVDLLVILLIVMGAGFNVAISTSLSKHLLDLELTEQNRVTFSQRWMDHVSPLLDNLDERQRSMTASNEALASELAKWRKW